MTVVTGVAAPAAADTNALQFGERIDAKLKKPVPLYFTYLTAWATPDGVIQFRRDLYDRDRPGSEAAPTY